MHNLFLLVEDASASFYLIAVLVQYVVIFFSKKLGFLYMMSREKRSSIEYTPYNLRIVTYDQIDPDNYMTISENGVINVYEGEASFTPLDRWEEEYK